LETAEAGLLLAESRADVAVEVPALGAQGLIAGRDVSNVPLDIVGCGRGLEVIFVWSGDEILDKRHL
jgi:hypothetical protein